ncbi:MAG: DUF885 domain-containing protein [Lachnospiraceae bacterium]|nr:DUF885 domain-containing protein [Lachnospiraceae bacterium]
MFKRTLPAAVTKAVALTLTAAMLVANIGCSKDTTTPKDAVRTAFDEFTEDIFIENICDNTINLHYTIAYPENYDIDTTSATLGEFGYDYMTESHNQIVELAEELQEFDYDLLSDEQKLTYRILEDAFEGELEGYEYIYYTEALSPLTGYQAQLPILLANYTFRCKTDVENYLELLADFDDYFLQIMEFENLKSEKGYFMPDFMVEDVIEQCKTFTENIDSNYLIETFNTNIEALDFLTAEEKDAYRKQNSYYVKNDVYRAYELIIDELTSLKGTCTNDAGLFYYKDGTAYYSYLVKCATGSDKSVKKLQDMTSTYIDESLKQIYSLLISNPELSAELETFSLPAEEPSATLDFLKEAIKDDFPALSGDTSCTIHSVHESLEESLSPAFFLVPPIDDTYSNSIYINNYYDTSNLFTTLAHEGYPGHLYQNVYAAAKDLPLIRNMLSFSGYTEGWATYAEYYSYHLSGIDENLAKALILNDSATLGLYAYLDMGIHYDGWLYEDVLEYLAIFGMDDEEVALDIYETMIENPTEYLSYFIGYMEIMELKELAIELMGDKYTPKAFHTFLLDIGPAPFYIIEEEMIREFD